ncbi:uncharacterized protein LOC124168310 isoform X2 [Ischnura elegans]|nr:uncharacterized protein LOC124168310 isoform X2 [Ischnura elegans]XP_046402422.1 uncharacterized protein LOC124168310 isoform X2 [Ischnura elegans]
MQCLRSELGVSTFHLLQSKLLLSFLEEAVENGGLSSSTAEKMKKVLLFGNLEEYLHVAQSGVEVSIGNGALLGLLKTPEYELRVKLTDEESPAVLNELRGIILMKNELIFQTFTRYHQNDSAEVTDENLNKLLERLKFATTTSLMENQDKEISEVIRKCHEKIKKCEEMLVFLVKIKLKGGDPLFTSVKRHNTLEAEALLNKSKELLADIKNEIFSEGGAFALEMLHKKQKEDMEIKKMKIIRMREELAQYESLKDDGFETILDEYLQVIKERKEKQKCKEDCGLGLHYHR